ncbi:MAG: hypothetical protein GX173_08190 [Ruminococcaceae bacterium]|nr:hypothetical protein [Oscillospiraceae bacterium]
MALAWLAGQPLNVLPVTSTGTIRHLLDSIDALQLQLTKQERLWLNLQTDELEDECSPG